MNIGIIGEFFLCLSLIFNVFSFLTKSRWDFRFYNFSLISIFFALGILVYAHLTSCSYLWVVIENTHVSLPWYFKLGAVWSSHECSMLLWIFLLSFIVFLLRFYIHYQDWIVVVKMHSFLIFGFVLFLFVGSNPFKTTVLNNYSGHDLNPILQDISLLIHPPILYVGTSLTIIPFYMATLILLNCERLEKIIQVMYQLTSLSWVFLTMGLSLGSFWAYYELGWGGFWFWDPVETIALIPWLLLTVLIHQIVRYKQSLKQLHFVILSGIFPFLSVFLGTILVRSGLLNSVHSFALNFNNTCFLIILFLFVVFAVFKIFFQGLKIEKNQKTTIGEQMLNVQGGILAILSFILFCGIIVPVLCKFFNSDIILEFEFFNNLFLFFAIPILLAMILTSPLVNLRQVLSKVIRICFISVLTWGIWIYFSEARNIKQCFLYFLVCWVITGKLYNNYSAIVKSPKKTAMVFAHLGIAILMVGIITSYYYKQTNYIVFDKSNRARNSHLKVHLKKLEHIENSLYNSHKIHLAINNYDLTLERRYYKTRSLIHDEVSIAGGLFSHYYVNILSDKKPYILQIQYKTFINLIWIGAFIMSIGGLLGFFMRFNRKTKAIS